MTLDIQLTTSSLLGPLQRKRFEEYSWKSFCMLCSLRSVFLALCLYIPFCQSIFYRIVSCIPSFVFLAQRALYLTCSTKPMPFCSLILRPSLPCLSRTLIIFKTYFWKSSYANINILGILFTLTITRSPSDPMSIFAFLRVCLNNVMITFKAGQLGVRFQFGPNQKNVPPGLEEGRGGGPLPRPSIVLGESKIAGAVQCFLPRHCLYNVP